MHIGQAVLIRIQANCNFQAGRLGNQGLEEGKFVFFLVDFRIQGVNPVIASRTLHDDNLARAENPQVRLCGNDVVTGEIEIHPDGLLGVDGRKAVEVFPAVRESVPVCIGQVGTAVIAEVATIFVRTDKDIVEGWGGQVFAQVLLHVTEAVEVRVGIGIGSIQRIEPPQDFPTIGDAITVCVGIGRVGIPGETGRTQAVRIIKLRKVVFVEISDGILIPVQLSENSSASCRASSGAPCVESIQPSTGNRDPGKGSDRVGSSEDPVGNL